MGNHDLAPNSGQPLSLIEVSNTADLLKCRPIVQQIATYGEGPVKAKVRMAVEKCAIGLNIELSDAQVVVLCEDLIDTYSHDSIEDVLECLKKGRRGVYGFGHNRRDTLNMVLIREWMGQHLSEKWEQRERNHSAEKQKPILAHFPADKLMEIYKIVDEGQKVKEAKRKAEKERNTKRFKLVKKYAKLMYQYIEDSDLDIQKAKEQFYKENGDVNEYLEKHLK